MDFTFLVPILLAILLIISLFFDPSRRLQAYWQRVCQGRAWKQSFPNATKDEIRQFLSLFADSFLVKQNNRLQFSPDDRIMEIYHTIYPSKFMADTLELEHFALNFKQQYNIDLVPIWRETITLGELFALTRAA